MLSLLPTPLEATLLAVYPLTLLFGSLFSHLSPSTHPPNNESVYSPQHQSYYPAHLAPSYFATKRNVFNVYFVKRGWGWLTLAVLLFAFGAARGRAAIELALPGLGDRWSWAAPRLTEIKNTAERREEQDARVRRRWQVLIRWAAATAAWFVVTQWCFGPSLIDRVYRLSGGACVKLLQEEFTAGTETQRMLASAASHAACRVAGGQWSGGYDVSGHVYLLVLGSGMLWLEVLPVVLPGVRGLTGARVVNTAEDGEMMLEDTEEADAVYGDAAYQERLEESLSKSSTRILADTVEDVAGAASPSHAYGTRTKTGSLRRDPASPGMYRIVNDREKKQRQQRQHHQGPLTKLKIWASTLAVAVAVLSWWMLLMTAAFFHTWSEKALALVLAGAGLWSVYILPRSVPLIRSWVGMPGV